MPFGLRAAFLAKENEKINQNKELIDAIWEYHLKK
jgi:hypothetical protein